MILFIAPNPHKEPNKEGFLQRVSAIDDLLADGSSVYYSDLDGTIEQSEALAAADLIYVHSIYSAKRILATYPSLAHKIITDLRGVVPEEEEYAGDIERATILSEVESEVFSYGEYFVAVSQAMVRHYNKKYPRSKRARWIILPIFEDATVKVKKKLPQPRNVIYAGGTQKWQNVERMVQAASESKNEYTYTFLTHDIDAFGMLRDTLSDRVDIRSVGSDEVGRYYEKATFGFILRDDMTINNVSCPTKLIEYLTYDIVPVVLTPSIGDLQELGYGYVTIDEFMSSAIGDARIKDILGVNHGVLKSLRRQTETGITSLHEVIRHMPHTDNKPLASDSIKKYLDLNEAYETKVHELWQANDTIARLTYELDEQRKVNHDHGRKLRFIRTSPLYKIAKKLRLIKAI